MKTLRMTILCTLGLLNAAGAQTKMNDLHKFLISVEVNQSCAPLYIQQAYKKNAAIGLPAGVLGSLLLGPVAGIFLYPTLAVTAGSAVGVTGDVLEKKRNKVRHKEPLIVEKTAKNLRTRSNQIDGNIRPVVIMPGVHHLIHTAEAILWAASATQQNTLSKHQTTVLRYLENKKAIRKCTPDLFDMVRKNGKDINDESCSTVKIESTTLADIKTAMQLAKKELSRAQYQWLESWGKLALKDGLTSKSKKEDLNAFNTKLLGTSLCENDKVLTQRQITKTNATDE